MNIPNTLVCLLHEHVTDIQETIVMAEMASFNMVIGPVTHSQYRREFNESYPMAVRHNNFTRSDLLLTANDWVLKYIMQLSPAIDCDSNDAAVRAHSEKMLRQELTWAMHLSQTGCFVIRLRHGTSMNLAQNLHRIQENLGCILIHIPWTNIRKERNKYRAKKNSQIGADEWDPWHDWNQFRRYCDYNKRVKIILEITHELPSVEQLNRWMGEPIEMIIIPHSLFCWSRNSSFYLPAAHLNACQRFLHQLHAHVAIKCPVDDSNIADYAKYIRHLANKVHSLQMIRPMASCFLNDDRLILSKYQKNKIDFGQNINVTGNRAIILNAYEEAFSKAIQDIVRTASATIECNTISLMIVGPGCNALISVVLAIAKNISQKLKIYIFDEDENVIISLTTAIERFYPNEDIIVISSRKQPELMGKMHVIGSLPFESMYHSQWLQFNFDQVRHFLRPNGAIIPQQSTLSIAPIMSSKIHNKVRHGDIIIDSKEVDVFEYETRSQSIFKIYPRNYYECATPKIVFSFEHRPNKRAPFCWTTESELTIVTFDIKLECVVIGFLGYFETVLYRNIELSQRKMTQLDDIVCPAITFYPLVSPQHLHAKQSLDATFRLFFDAHKDCVWLEWNTNAPIISPVHNFKGRTHRMSFKRKDSTDDVSEATIQMKI